MLPHGRLNNPSEEILAILYKDDDGDGGGAAIIPCSINTELKNQDVPQNLAAEIGYNFLAIPAGFLSYEYTIYRAISSNPCWSFVYHVRGKYDLVCPYGSKEHTIFVSVIFFPWDNLLFLPLKKIREMTDEFPATGIFLNS